MPRFPQRVGGRDFGQGMMHGAAWPLFPWYDGKDKGMVVGLVYTDLYSR